MKSPTRYRRELLDSSSGGRAPQEEDYGLEAVGVSHRESEEVQLQASMALGATLGLTDLPDVLLSSREKHPGSFFFFSVPRTHPLLSDTNFTRGLGD